MANLITFLRFLLLLVLLVIVYSGDPWWQLANAPLVVLMIAMDGLDGYIARKRGEESLFGATFDIAVDRIVENVLWVVMAHQGLIGVWVPLLFIVRGTLVDAIRTRGAAEGTAAFDMMQTPVGRFLVAGRFMRFSYAAVKAAAFAWILLWQPFPELAPAFWAEWAGPIELTSLALVVVAATMCVLRGLPVVVEFVFSGRNATSV